MRKGTGNAGALLAGEGTKGYVLRAMPSFKAHVRNGRLVLDEPTDLPEGEVVELVRADEDFSDEEREELHRALDAGLAAADSGDHVDADVVVNELLSRS
jgi:hypothetical protein